MSNENLDLTIITDFIKQLEHCHTPFEVSRAVLRNFVGYFMPEKAAFYLAPNASFPFFKCIDRYGIHDDLPQEIPGNGGIVSISRNLSGANLITDTHLYNLIKVEQNILIHFQYFLPLTNQSHYGGILLFSMKKNKEMELNAFDTEYLNIISALSAKTFHSFIKPVDLHLDKVTKLYTKDYLWSMMENYKHIARELVPSNNISFDLTKKVLARKATIVGANGENSIQIGYSIILLRIINLNELNVKFDFEKGNKVLQQFSLELKLLLRRSDIPARYEGSQFVVLLPLTTKVEALTLKPDLQKMLAVVKKKQMIPDDFPISLKIGFAHFPIDGEESYLLIKSAENDLHD